MSVGIDCNVVCIIRLLVVEVAYASGVRSEASWVGWHLLGSNWGLNLTILVNQGVIPWVVSRIVPCSFAPLTGL